MKIINFYWSVREYLYRTLLNIFASLLRTFYRIFLPNKIITLVMYENIYNPFEILLAHKEGVKLLYLGKNKCIIWK